MATESLGTRAEQELSQAPASRGTVLTVGVFDGVHLGHQYLFQQVCSQAEANGCASAVLTFRNHPLVVLGRLPEVHYVTPLEERLRLIYAQGIDLAVLLTFDLELSYLTAREFVSLLQRHLHMRAMVMGPGFALGHNREGDFSTLTSLGQELGFTVHQVEPQLASDVMISSTLIRQSLDRGEVDRVADMLGRHFSLVGEVARGAGRGQGLGFPTANLVVSPEQAIPADGIYATWASVGGRRFPAATSIGTRPTFGPGERTIEAFLLDFQGDLYGQPLTLEFVQRLRDEERFDSPEELVAQMHRDVAQARSVLAFEARG